MSVCMDVRLKVLCVFVCEIQRLKVSALSAQIELKGAK